MKGYILGLFLFGFSCVYGQDSLQLPLSGTMITLLGFGEDSSGVLLYNMHDNENSSALAGRLLGKKYGGRYYELMHNGKRNISFLLGEDSLHIDPNRIYTDTGVWQQLARNNNTDTLAFRLIAAWRDSLLSLLKINQRTLVIALHNNTDQNYGFGSYMSGGEYENEAEAVYKGCVLDEDDFYFVTDYPVLDKLCFGQYHVVLQAYETLTDDGSLSVYCARYGIPYVNVEAQHGHFFRQLRMLLFAYQQLVSGR
jgi:hypothetical protein